MISPALTETIRHLLSDDKGLLAIDESNTTCNARFRTLGIAETEEMRRAWREVIVTTPLLGEAISGVILYDETLYQRTSGDVLFTKVLADAGILTGIKVDIGATDLAGHPGEKVTEGLDGLRDRLGAYRDLGARFAKWRAVIQLEGDAPSPACLDANAHALARYAALCQEAEIVPIVEAEVLMTGSHSLETCRRATDAALHAVFEHLRLQGVALEGIILKPNMVLPGLDASLQPTAAEVAAETLACFSEVVPTAIAGIAFLSGGQSGPLASARLNAMNSPVRPPWALTFSFGRAIQEPALAIWRGEPCQVWAAQTALLHRATLDRAARRGIYEDIMEMT